MADPPTDRNAPTHLGTLHALSVSDGGVPKRATPSAEVTVLGVAGDRQAHPKFHGGPERAVCLLGLDVIEALRDEGHPIAPGTAGENMTLSGFPWSAVTVGTRLLFDGGVELEVSSWAVPCKQIAGSFQDGDSSRLHVDEHPGRARAYTRVLRPGVVREGDRVRVVPPD